MCVSVENRVREVLTAALGNMTARLSGRIKYRHIHTFINRDEICNIQITSNPAVIHTETFDILSYSTIPHIFLHVVVTHTHTLCSEFDEKGGNGCDVGVFFLLGSGVKVESLWHL